MMNKKNIIYLISGLVLIVGLYFAYSYFGNKEGDTTAGSSAPAGQDTIFQGGEKSLPAVSAEPSAANGQPGISLNGSDNGVLNLVSLMERLKLDVSFFDDEKFKDLRDFTKEVAVSEDEKGNINPFRPVAAIFISSGAKNASSTE